MSCNNCPTFKEIFEQSGLNIDDLVGYSQRYYAAVSLMLKGEPVLKAYAEAVLASLSELTSQHYGLDNVSVHLYHTHADNQSEMAAHLAKIDTEFQAAQRGMKELAEGTARHQFITARMEHMHQHLEELSTKFGVDAAMQAVIAWQDSVAVTASGSTAP